MLEQTTFSTAGFDRYAKTTKRAAFLAEMELVVPWSELCGLVEPFYPRGETGRQPFGLERMLRICRLQQWFNLSDPAAEEALYDSLSMRRFVGIDLGREPVPDETTICRFRHLLEAHDFGRRMFECVHEHPEAKGLRLSSGMIVDATIIDGPSSTKNEEKARDPDTHQTKKGNQWYFGTKAHFGVDRRAKVIHSVVATSADKPVYPPAQIPNHIEQLRQITEKFRPWKMPRLKQGDSTAGSNRKRKSSHPAQRLPHAPPHPTTSHSGPSCSTTRGSPMTTTPTCPQSSTRHRPPKSDATNHAAPAAQVKNTKMLHNKLNRGSRLTLTKAAA